MHTIMNNLKIPFRSACSHIQKQKNFLIKLVMMVVFLTITSSMLNSYPNQDGDHHNDPVNFTTLTAEAVNMVPAFYDSGNSRFRTGFARVIINEINTFGASSINALQRVITLPGKRSEGSWLPEESFEPGPDVVVRLSLLRVSNILFAGISGEIFSEIGMKLKELSPYKNNHVITYCNGDSGYLITDSAYPQGWYEVSATRVMSGAERVILDNFIEMLNEFRNNKWQL